jgi:type VI secretion system protein ImpJ
MIGVLQVRLFLANLLAEISPHPYLVYEQIKYFYIDLCVYHNTPPKFADSIYRHEQLARVFSEILTPLNEELQLSPTRSPYLPFGVVEGIMRVELPEIIREAKQVYLLIQKNRVTKLVNIDVIKLASISRIPVVHKFYLQGIPCKRIENPPFQHSFGPEVDIYQLSEGEEWDHALTELAFGFYADAKFSDEKFYLYWRLG